MPSPFRYLINAADVLIAVKHRIIVVRPFAAQAKFGDVFHVEDETPIACHGA
jgi:hypothetical protein